jgi:hypothetical protein
MACSILTVSGLVPRPGKCGDNPSENYRIRTSETLLDARIGFYPKRKGELGKTGVAHVFYPACSPTHVAALTVKHAKEKRFNVIKVSP